MGIITISRGSYSRGNEIANRLAEKLGYKCISREILLKASKDFNIPELTLNQAIRTAPSVLDFLTNKKRKYIKYIRHAFLERILQDNIVYHGFAGHFLSKDVPNVLKVRITADTDFRIKRVMLNENISETEARKYLQQIDAERRKWSLSLYNIDQTDIDLYDAVIHISCMNVEGAVSILYDLARKPCFQTTAETKKKLTELMAESGL